MVCRETPPGPWTETEIAYTPPTFERFETTNDPAIPVFSIFGTVTGPPTFIPPPTPPDRFVYASWANSYGVAFDYTPTGMTGMDSAVLYYWGNNETTAIELFLGETVSVTQYLYAIPGAPPAPTPVPAMTPIGIAALIGMLGLIGAGIIMRRR